MTDHPRFRPMNGVPGEQHRHYHGAPVVDFVFRLADWWLDFRNRHRVASSKSLARSQHSALLGSALMPVFAVLALMMGAPQASAQDPVRVRGVIENVAVDGVYVIRTRDGGIVRLKLDTNVSVAASVRSSLSDIRPGHYIGIAAVPLADGTLRALEAHIFDESMRGTAEGHRAWDLAPQSTMTNAVVQSIVAAIDGHSVTLSHKNGHQRILIPAGTIVVTYVPGSVAELKAGAAIFIPGAAVRSDGTLVAQRVMVGRDIAPPQ